jgi:hypothetical protein
VVNDWGCKKARRKVVDEMRSSALSRRDRGSVQGQGPGVADPDKLLSAVGSMPRYSHVTKTNKIRARGIYWHEDVAQS